MSAALHQTGMQESKSWLQTFLLRNYCILLLTQKEPEGIFITLGISAVTTVHLRNLYIPVC